MTSRSVWVLCPVYVLILLVGYQDLTAYSYIQCSSNTLHALDNDCDSRKTIFTRKLNSREWMKISMSLKSREVSCVTLNAARHTIHLGMCACSFIWQRWAWSLVITFHWLSSSENKMVKSRLYVWLHLHFKYARNASNSILPLSFRPQIKSYKIVQWHAHVLAWINLKHA